MHVKTADEMFEELGYEKHSSKSMEIFDLYSPDDGHLIRILFNLITKRIVIHCDNDALDIQELQAINKKCEELKWIQKNNIECYFIRKDSFDYITYECSNCEEEWCLTDGTPEENCYNYCPKCGAKIIKIIERGE